MTLPSGTVTFLFTDIEGSTKLARVNLELWEVSLKMSPDDSLEWC
jgi:class 3 adenylate cyclase